MKSAPPAVLLLDAQTRIEANRVKIADLQAENDQLETWLALYTAPEQSIAPKVVTEPCDTKPKRIWSDEMKEKRRQYQRDRRANLAKANGTLPKRKYTKRGMGGRNKLTGKLSAIQGFSEAESRARGANSPPDPINDTVEIEPTPEERENINAANLEAASHSLPSLKQKLTHLKSEYELARAHANVTESALLAEDIQALKSEIDALQRMEAKLNPLLNLPDHQ
jgi:hypothetical protein